jgi:hypothetical protein
MSTSSAASTKLSSSSSSAYVSPTVHLSFAGGGGGAPPRSKRALGRDVMGATGSSSVSTFSLHALLPVDEECVVELEPW